MKSSKKREPKYAIPVRHAASALERTSTSTTSYTVFTDLGLSLQSLVRDATRSAYNKHTRTPSLRYQSRAPDDITNTNKFIAEAKLMAMCPSARARGRV